MPYFFLSLPNLHVVINNIIHDKFISLAIIFKLDPYILIGSFKYVVTKIQASEKTSIKQNENVITQYMPGGSTMSAAYPFIFGRRHCKKSAKTTNIVYGKKSEFIRDQIKPPPNIPAAVRSFKRNPSHCTERQRQNFYHIWCGKHVF